ncbi:MAG: NUDIX domain-containing protein [Candidatus Latescibacteria bacterium]|nr:NUDIX domain-containing protein [Candidatus Latescibacterota bacterium]
MVESWDKLSSKPLGDFRVFRVRQDRYRSPRTGVEHDFFVQEMPEWVNIIPLTPAGKVVLIHQYRHGTERMSLEIPGGLAESEDGSFAEGARRELVEETGYEPERVISLGKVAPNPALQDNHCHSFLALGARPTGAQKLDPGEDIAVEEFDLEAIPQLIAEGRLEHSLVVVAFYLFEQYRRQHPEILAGQG